MKLRTALFSILIALTAGVHLLLAGWSERLGVAPLLEKHPQSDGRGVTVAVLGGGIPHRYAQEKTSTGKPLLKAAYDVSGAGDVELVERETLEGDTVRGLSGQLLKLDPKWAPPAGAKVRVGLFEVGRVLHHDWSWERSPLVEPWKQEIADKRAHLQTEIKVLQLLSEEERENEKPSLAELQARLKMLEAAAEDSEPGPVYDCLVVRADSQWRLVVDIDSDGDLADEKLHADQSNTLTLHRHQLGVHLHSEGEGLTFVAALPGERPGPLVAKNRLAPGAQIVSIRVFDGASDCSPLALRRGLAAARAAKADIVFVEGASPFRSQFPQLERELNRAARRGVTVVFESPSPRSKLAPRLAEGVLPVSGVERPKIQPGGPFDWYYPDVLQLLAKGESTSELPAACAAAAAVLLSHRKRIKAPHKNANLVGAIRRTALAAERDRPPSLLAIPKSEPQPPPEAEPFELPAEGEEWPIEEVADGKDGSIKQVADRRIVVIPPKDAQWLEISSTFCYRFVNVIQEDQATQYSVADQSRLLTRRSMSPLRFSVQGGKPAEVIFRSGKLTFKPAKLRIAPGGFRGLEKDIVFAGGESKLISMTASFTTVIATSITETRDAPSWLTHIRKSSPPTTTIARSKHWADVEEPSPKSDGSGGDVESGFEFEDPDGPRRSLKKALFKRTRRFSLEIPVSTSVTFHFPRCNPQCGWELVNQYGGVVAKGFRSRKVTIPVDAAAYELLLVDLAEYESSFSESQQQLRYDLEHIGDADIKWPIRATFPRQIVHLVAPPRARDLDLDRSRMAPDQEIRIATVVPKLDEWRAGIHADIHRWKASKDQLTTGINHTKLLPDEGEVVGKLNLLAHGEQEDVVPTIHIPIPKPEDAKNPFPTPQSHEQAKQQVWRFRLDQLGRLSEAGNYDTFDKLADEMLEERPADLELRMLVLARLDNVKQRKANLPRIVDAADAALALIDEEALRKQLDDHPASLKANKQRAVLTDALYRKGRALGYMELPDVIEKHPIEDPEAHDKAFEANFARLGEWVNTTDVDNCLLHVRWHRRKQRYGQALLVLQKHIDNSPLNYWYFKKKRDLFAKLGWSELANRETRRLLIEFPSERHRLAE